jgi:hypothetical protein
MKTLEEVQQEVRPGASRRRPIHQPVADRRARSVRQVAKAQDELAARKLDVQDARILKTNKELFNADGEKGEG